LFKLSFAAVLLFALCVCYEEADAQGMGVCTVANTCSEAFFQCVAVNCPVIFDARCTGACRSRFNGCMRTGAFRAPDCRDRTLDRK
jgi:hypothetical protein